MSREAQLRRRARELLGDKSVVMVLGYRPAKRDGAVQPAFTTRPEDADVLVFDDRCGTNLAAYLPRVKHLGRIAVVAKGCDSRSIVGLLKEKQVTRDQLVILGVGCEGVKENGRLSDACTTCAFPNPVICDEMLGDKAPERGPATDPLAEFEKFTPDERWQALADDVSRCIRCYACRQVCPNCYCPTCFVDSGSPQWVGKTTADSDNMMFHLMRAMHMAGRCVECGACSRGCPMGIDLMRFNRKVAKVVKERFGATAGLNPDEPPALAAFEPSDKQEFIR